ncbi:UVR8 [Symbiodinium sp. CCMP2592]|nr:UVR8 [Symbiodinium sp. CCMP2592]
MEHKTEVAGWLPLFSETGPTGATWKDRSIRVPEGTVALRLLAGADAASTVEVGEIMAVDTVPNLANLTCGFGVDMMCGWSMGTFWLPSNLQQGPQFISTFRDGDAYMYNHVLMYQSIEGQSFLTSPMFPASSEFYFEFAYQVWGQEVGILELQYLWRDRWWRRWSARGSDRPGWLQAKVTLPANTTMLRLLSADVIGEAYGVAVDSVVAWVPAVPGPVPPVSVSLSAKSNGNCALLLAGDTNGVKCWGETSDGLRGSFGLRPGEMGAALPFVDLGSTKVVQLACGDRHSCAVFEGGALRCWGEGDAGRLGYGSDSDVGDSPAEMGDALPAVDVGGHAVLEVELGEQHTCVLLHGGSVKCFGKGYNGRLGLGLGDGHNFGHWPGTMGNRLPFVDLGTDFHATQLALGRYHTCALSSSGGVKCWGEGPAVGLGFTWDSRNELGISPNLDKGDEVGSAPNQMGDNLPYLDLGLEALQISAGRYFTCAVLGDHSVRCWGRNELGQLGQGHNVDQPLVTPSLPSTPLGDGTYVLKVVAGAYHACAVLQDESLKCWGWGNSGQLGQGNIENLGDEPAEMGDALLPVNLNNLAVRQVTPGWSHTCVYLEDDTVRCFGSNTEGQLGIGSNVGVGTAQGEMGAALVPAEVFHVTPGYELEDLRLGSGGSEGWLQLQYNGSYGLVCDDSFSDATAQVVCRDLGMAGGRALFRDPVSDLSSDKVLLEGTILADRVACDGTEVSLRDCSFRGWSIHGCTPREAAGVRCELDAWSEYTAGAGSSSPVGRQDHSMVFDPETQSALVFGGEAAMTFQYFSDLWQYHWPSRTWAELSTVSELRPTRRSGHSAVWDSVSRTMMVFAGSHLGETYSDMWAYRLQTWELWTTFLKPRARAYHTAVWDPVHRAMLAFAGEGGGETLSDLFYFSFEHRAWTAGAVGLEQRSRHAAAWDASTRSMIVFGGWDGHQYLSSLHRYDAWADRWAELAATGAVPLPRGGHVASWDPASMSFLVFGGIQDQSEGGSEEVLSYSSGFYSFSLLTRTWTDLGPGAEAPPGPSGRAYSAAVFDAASPALLLFGGFNVSYLQELWRYVMAPRPPSPVLRCQLGQPCHLDGLAVGNSGNASDLTVKTTCPDSLVALPSAEVQNMHTSGLFSVEPGSYQLCWCDDSHHPNCSSPQDFTGAMGHFTAEGPYSNQSASCYIGFQCTVPVWRGVGVSSNDSLIAQKDCENLEASSYSGLPVSINESGSAFLLDMGIIGFGPPEVVELCWCPSGHPCASLQDFRVVALRMQILCPPGQYEQNQACQLCPADTYCPGGRAPQSCPAASEAPRGSSQLSQCECLPGYYRTPESSRCTSCPYGSTTLEAGATSLAACICQPNFVNMEPENPDNVSVCECGPGFGFDRQTGVCSPCEQGSYKETAGNALCSGCPVDKSTLEEASRSIQDCLCRPGSFSVSSNQSGGDCSTCHPGSYCNGTGIAFECQEGANSTAGARSPDECICRAGHFQRGSSCELCQRGRYKSSDSNEVSCPLQCPTSAESEEGSISRAACFCQRGFYAELDPNGVDLARCASCANFASLSCPGGFAETSNSPNSHRLPVAIPGYFQTGTLTAVKCFVVLDNGLSVCLGSGQCQSDEEVDCVGKYGNACEEGSTGILCGECPPGWARSGFRAACRPCGQAILPLVASILGDVGSKVTINFIVAAMAATEAARGSSKLHTIIIRIATQWLAASSVLATFQLDQIPVQLPWQEDIDGVGGAGSAGSATFAWPVEVTVAMRNLFDSLTLTPALVSVDFAAQCRAQELSDHPAAARIAQALYNICLPLLMMVGAVVVSWLAVNVLVPLAARLGLSFNEAGRRRRAHAKLLSRARDALERTLSQVGLALSVVELEEFGALDVPPAVLREAVSQPKSFLRDAVVSSHGLLIRACTARARSRDQPVDVLALDKVDLTCVRNDYAGTADVLDLLDNIIDANSGPALEAALVRQDPEADQPEMELHADRQAPSEKPASTQIKHSPDSGETQIVVAPLPVDSAQTLPLTSRLDADVELDEVMDSLDFGLFTARPRICELIYQSVPVIWIALISVWPSLLSNFLSMLWCVPIVEDGQVVSRLLPNPDVECWTDAHFPSAWIALTGLVVWCLGIPLSLAVVLFRLDRQSPETNRRFGYFTQGLERDYWWWDILMKRIDVGIMMVITFTSAVQDPAMKLLLFPVLSGVQAVLAAWVKPYANDQAEILDVLEVTLASVRFFLFSGVAALMILNPESGIMSRWLQAPRAPHSFASVPGGRGRKDCSNLVIHDR